MTTKLYARAEVIRMLQIGEDLLLTLARERIVAGQPGGYTPEDVERIRVAHELAELGVNAAGLDVILEMRDHWLAERHDLLEIIQALRAKPPSAG
jgi:hypothetical protein